jgi:hypothetical protein
MHLTGSLEMVKMKRARGHPNASRVHPKNVSTVILSKLLCQRDSSVRLFISVFWRSALIFGRAGSGSMRAKRNQQKEKKFSCFEVLDVLF